MTLQWLGQGQALNLIAGHYYRARFLMPAPPCPITNTRLTQVKTLLNRLGSKTESDWESWTVSKTTGPGWTVLKIPDPSYFDGFPPSPWPGNMREVPPALNPNGLCPVWTWAKSKQNVTVPLDAVRGVLGPLGGVLLNFWDETTGQRVYDAPLASLAPGQFLPGYGLVPGGQISPGIPPLIPGGGQASPGIPPLIPGGGQTSPGIPPLVPGGQTSPGIPPVPPPIQPPFTPTQPTQPTEKKANPLVVAVVVGALAIGAIALLR